MTPIPDLTPITDSDYPDTDYPCRQDSPLLTSPWADRAESHSRLPRTARGGSLGRLFPTLPPGNHPEALSDRMTLREDGVGRGEPVGEDTQEGDEVGLLLGG